MSLLSRLREKQSGRFATAIPAISAISDNLGAATVARIATVAVASVKDEKTDILTANDKTDPLAVTKPITTVSVFAMPEVATESPLDPLAVDDGMNSLFQSKGIASDDAAALVKRLAQRDAEWDDRRSCGECANLHRLRCIKKRCPVGGDPSEVFILHRCQDFQQNEVNND